MKQRELSFYTTFAIMLLSTSVLFANPQTDVDFETKILPILQNRCLKCHSAPTKNVPKPKGDVQLDSVKGINESRHGEVIIAGEPRESLLYQRITLPEGETGIMPPTEDSPPLTKQETDMIELWIKQGADYGQWTGNKPQHIPSKSNSHQPTIMPPITSLVFSPDGKFVLASSQAGLHIYDYPSLNQTKLINVDAYNIHDITFSPNGDRFAVGGGNPAREGIIEIFTWDVFKSLKKLKRHKDSVMDVSWRDNNTLASASLDRSIILWNIQKGEPIQQFEGHSRGVSSLCFLKDNQILVSTGIDQNIRVWNLETGELIRSMNNHTLPVHALALRPNVSGLPMLVSVGDDKTVRFWQPTIGRMVKFARLKGTPLDVSWMNNGTKVVASCDDGVIRIVDPESVEVKDEIQGLSGWVYSLAVHPTDGSIIIGGVNGQVKRFIP